ncbi:hypothetical protein ACRALDRAFT_1072463 [Sodiomyces alcalophilus JCM 7366]|uniref:uncharacterized protein n=1 Tax=Sodiomyces alcalophilus JCM 7366 TaxID=591952 RepID=UPI0039B5F0C8
MMGFFLGNAIFTALKALRQTYMCWKGLGRKVSVYIIMVWVSWTCGVVQSGLNYAYMRDDIQPSYWLFVVEVNRVSLLMYDLASIKRLKITVFILILILNAGVMVMWVPAQLEVKRFVLPNAVWHRVEKSIFLIIDASLHIFFLYLVRSRLIRSGLTKYRMLYRFNVCMVVISLSFDITVIGLVSLDHSEIYVQFRTLSYMVKLHIEMSIAEFIARVVNSSSVDQVDMDLASYGTLGGEAAPGDHGQQ